MIILHRRKHRNSQRSIRNLLRKMTAITAVRMKKRFETRTTITAVRMRKSLKKMRNITMTSLRKIIRRTMTIM